MNVTFIGGGNMATALITGMLHSGHAAAGIRVIDHNAAARARLEAAFGIRTWAVPEASALDCDVVVLAVKPQQLETVCRELAPLLNGALALSIAAGVPIALLEQWLDGRAPVVRAMPNTPAQIQKGVTGACAAAGIDPARRQLAAAVLEPAGALIWVAEEAAIDAVTAISGSGPAYVFQFMEALAAAAEDMGFDAATARRLVVDTFAGAAALAAASPAPLAELRQRVTSKGGTTEQALLTMNDRQVADGIRAGAQAALARARELAAQLALRKPV